jgi:1-deoxyxylulose-5-phosphate synthase
VLQIHNATPALLDRGALLEELRALRDDDQVVALGGTVYGEAAALAAIDAGLDVVQVAFSALDRRPAARVLPAAAAAGAGVVARSTLLRGVLSPAAATLAADRPAFAALAAAADAFRRAVGVSWERLPGAAVAYAAATPGIDTVLLGPASVAELDALVAAASDPITLVPGWERDLPVELLDPSRWPDQ